MKAAVLFGAHDWRIEEYPTPEVRENEVLLKIKACGVCHSEIHQWNNKINGLEYPRFIGHEVAGEVLKTGSKVTDFKEGDRVAAWTDGRGYAEEIAVKQEMVFKIHDNISFAEAMAEPIACTTNGVIRAGIQMNDTVALVGTGFMGLILLQELKLRGVSSVITIDIRDEMLELAKVLGADVTLNPVRDDITKKIKELTNGRGVDVSFEVGGVQATLDLAPQICRMEGKLIIFGYHPGERRIQDLGFWNWMAFDIINAHFRDVNTILKGTKIGMDLLNNGKILMKPLITHKYNLNEIEAAFTAAHQKPEGFVKSVIVMN
ncbi:MAG TPA: zinc-binding dehydrogenase [Ignavibacteriaceae bacterium]|jgi:L-iditol 2-dehydrogenase|nr:zinc-binding dehydrogenase [Ignavibacteriaceae bacterium]